MSATEKTSGGRRDTGDESISDWLTSLARTGANPGGGAAAAVMAGMAAALAEMVAAYRTSAKSAEVAVSAKATAAFAAAMRTSAPALADEDTAASSGFAEASKAGPDPETRAAAKRSAGLRAAESSVELGRFVEQLVPVLSRLAGEAGEFLLSDVGTAAAALAAGARAAGLNILADLRIAGEDGAGRDDLREAVAALHATAAELDALVTAVWERLSA